MIFADLIVLSDWVIAVGKCCCLLVCWGQGPVPASLPCKAVCEIWRIGYGWELTPCIFDLLKAALGSKDCSRVPTPRVASASDVCRGETHVRRSLFVFENKITSPEQQDLELVPWFQLRHPMIIGFHNAYDEFLLKQKCEPLTSSKATSSCQPNKRNFLS